MNGTLRGIVTGLDRASQAVHAVLEDGQEIDAAYLGGSPPWPLAGALFTDEPISLCLGPLGDRRELFHDDFMWGFAASATRWDGDGNWNGTTTGTAAIADEDDPGAGQAGAVRLQAASSSIARIRKVNGAVTPPEDGQALWMACHVRPTSTLVSSGQMAIGLGSAGWFSAFSDQAVYVEGSSSDTWRLTNLGVGGGTVTGVDTGDEIVGGAWVWIDLMLVAGAWTAIWINGSGPWVNTADVPASGAAGLTPFTEAAAAGALDIDRIELALVTPANDPTTLALGGDLSHGGNGPV